MPLKRDNVLYFNPRVENKNDNVPVSHTCYKVVNQDMWISMIGCIGDWYWPDFASDFKEKYPDLKLIINVYPIFCCPGLLSEAIYKKVEKEIGIPIVSITYDGTQADKNKVLNPYLYFLRL